MFKSKKQEFAFTCLTSFVMIFIMGVYNVALHGGGLHWETFPTALKSFPVEWLIGLIFAYFAAGRLAKRYAFRVACAGDRPIFKILCIQTFTVMAMVPFMSLVGTIESGILQGFDDEFVLLWLETIAFNFIMAYPLQILIVGPLCRRIFKIIINAAERRKTKKETIKEVSEDER